MKAILILLIACVLCFFIPAHAALVDFTVTDSFYFTADDGGYTVPLGSMVGIAAYQDTLYISDMSIGTGGFYVTSINDAGSYLTPYSWYPFDSPIVMPVRFLLLIRMCSR